MSYLSQLQTPWWPKLFIGSRFVLILVGVNKFTQWGSSSSQSEENIRREGQRWRTALKLILTVLSRGSLCGSSPPEAFWQACISFLWSNPIDSAFMSHHQFRLILPWTSQSWHKGDKIASSVWVSHYVHGCPHWRTMWMQLINHRFLLLILLFVADGMHTHRLNPAIVQT